MASGPTLTWLLEEICPILAPPAAPFSEQKTMIFVSIVVFQHLHCHLLQNNNNNKQARHCLTMKKKKRYGDSFQLPQNVSPNNRTRVTVQNRITWAVSARVCVCLCLLTEIVQSVFSNRCCTHSLTPSLAHSLAHFLALIRSQPAFVMSEARQAATDQVDEQ